MAAKSARKCTELLFTRIFIASGAMPTVRYMLRSSSCALAELTAMRTPPMRRHAIGPRSEALPFIIGPP
jgi:hypothetical protein